MRYTVQFCRQPRKLFTDKGFSLPSKKFQREPQIVFVLYFSEQEMNEVVVAGDKSDGIPRWVKKYYWWTVDQIAIHARGSNFLPSILVSPHNPEYIDEF